MDGKQLRRLKPELESFLERYLGLFEGSLPALEVGPQGCRLLSIRPARPHPQVVGTTLHYTQGGVELRSEQWDAEARTLTVELALPGEHRGSVFVATGNDYDPAGATGEGVVYRPACRCAVASLTLKGAARVVFQMNPAAGKPKPF